MRKLLPLLCLGLLAPSVYGEPSTEPSRAQPGAEVSVPRVRSPFAQGRFTLSVAAGTQSSLGERYFVVGGTGGYFLFQGFEVSAGIMQWFGSGPSVTQLRPRLRYVVSFFESPVYPYVSTNYDHWFIGDGLADVDAVSAGGGIVVSMRRNVLLTLGARYEWIISNCTIDCTAVLPEIAFALAF